MAIATEARLMNFMRPNRRLFAVPEVTPFTKQVLATHSDEPPKFLVTPLLGLIEQIFLRAKLNDPQGTTQVQLEAIEDSSPSPTDLPDSVSLTIHRVSNEIQYKCSRAEDLHTVTREVLNLLTNWPWDAQAVLALAAFSINYGEFWLLVHQSSTDLLARDISLLKKLPQIFKRVDILRQKFEAIDKLNKALVDVAKCIVNLKMLPPHYITPNTPKMKSATTLIQQATYWIVRSIITCAAQITGFIGVGHEYLASASDAWELSSLADVIDIFRRDLEQLLQACHQYIPEKMHHEAHTNLVRLFEIPHLDNNMILKVLSFPKNDEMPLIDCGISKKDMDLATAARKMSPMKPDRQLFAVADDKALSKQVLTNHSDKTLEFLVTPLLSLTEQIFLRAKLNDSQGTTQAQLEAIEDSSPSPTDLLDLLDFVSFTIHRVSNEIQYKCSRAGEPHTVAMEVLNLLTNWPWDAKTVLALAAFSINYGEFWLLVHQSPTDLLAKDISLLKKLPEIFESVDIVRQKFEAIDKLINALIGVAKCIVDFKMLPPHYITPDTPEMKSATTLIPTAVYWIVRSIIACAAQITGLIGVGHEYLASASETWELSSLADMIDNFRKDLEQLLQACHQYIHEKMHHEAYMNLVRLFEIPHLDNNKILKAVIYSKNDKMPLIDCGISKKNATLDVLRKKNVLLLISDLDLFVVEFSMLDEIYRESRQNKTRSESDYEVVWMPIVEAPWTEEKQNKFEGLLSLMPWYSVAHPSLIESAVIKYVRQVWHFNKKPLLVVLDPQGKVVNTNAVHMLWIWGSLAYPFTSAREESLWKEETWRLELLVDSVEPLIFTWMETGKSICLCGGEDMAWVRSFSKEAKEVAWDANVELEILYVGKSNPGERIRKNIAAILAENVIHTLADPTLIWFFWVRLESMLYSKIQRGNTIEEDPIMQETMTMLSLDSGDQGWALVFQGSTNIVRATAEMITKVVEGYEERWKETAKEEGFVPAMSKDLQNIHTPEHCNRLILPYSIGIIPEKVVCSECGSAMEKFIMYRCCND